MVSDEHGFDEKNELDEWVRPPKQRHGTFLAFDFEGAD
jgi:hypothetical protein